MQERIVNFVEILSSAPLTTHGTKPHGRAEKEPDKRFPKIKDLTADDWQKKRSSYFGKYESKFSRKQLSPQTMSELVSVLAQNLIDVNWSVINNPKDMAILLYEWEHDLASAYPDMWETYKDTIKGYSDNYIVSSGNRSFTEVVNGENKPRTITTMKDEMHAIRADLSSYLKREYKY